MPAKRQIRSAFPGCPIHARSKQRSDGCATYMHARSEDLLGSALIGAHAHDLQPVQDPAAAVERIREIYEGSVERIRLGFRAAAKGGAPERVGAFYPYVAVPIGRSDLHIDARLSYGVL